VDHATVATSQKEFGGVQLYIKLKVRGNNFQVIVDEVLAEDRVISLFIKVMAPSHIWVYSRHRAIGSRGACFLAIFMFKDQVKGLDGGVVEDFGHCLGVIGGECWWAWFQVEVFLQPLELLLGQGRQRHRLGCLGPNNNWECRRSTGVGTSVDMNGSQPAEVVGELSCCNEGGVFCGYAMVTFNVFILQHSVFN
jgi:hypothetical protein